MRREKLSEAEATTDTSRAPAASAAWNPSKFGTSTGKRAPGTLRTPASTAADPAICGTQRGETKLPTSTVRRPQATSASTIATRSATPSARASF